MHGAWESCDWLKNDPGGSKGGEETNQHQQLTFQWVSQERGQRAEGHEAPPKAQSPMNAQVPVLRNRIAV